MKLLILNLLAALVFNVAASAKPSDHNDATDALVENWQAPSLQTWPFLTAPFTEYSPKMTLLTPSAAHLPPPTETLDRNGFQPFQPHPMQQQQMLPLQQYFLLNSAYYGALFEPFASPAQPTSAETAKVERDVELVTHRSPGYEEAKPIKLQSSTDSPLIAAVENVNIATVIPSTARSDDAKESPRPFGKLQQSKGLSGRKSATLKAKKTKTSPNYRVKVESVGKTSTKGNIPQIPFGTYFLPYFASSQLSGKKIPALILEPHSKAIVGNGGTAISTPISRAFLKRGVATNVYFNPESVAIAGAGGKAHAQADLELDVITDRT